MTASALTLRKQTDGLSFVMIDDRTIGYRATGEQGPAIIFLHGSHRSGYIFRQNLDLGAEWARCFAPDRPGYGASGDVGDEEQMPDMTELVAKFIAALGIERPFLFGESRGGGIAIEVAQRHPGLVRGLILCSPIGLPPNELPKPADIEAVRSWPWFVERSVENPSIFTDSDKEQVLADLAKAKRYEERRAESVSATYKRVGLVEKLVAIDIPSILFWGRQDPVFPVECVARFAELMANLRRIVILDNARHLAFFERPLEVDEALREFCRTVA